MNSYHLTLGAGLGGLRLKQHPDPQPRPREVVVRVRAVYLNFRELSMQVIDARAMIAAVATLRGMAVSSRAQFAAMNRAIAAHRLRPVIDRLFSFDEAPAAFAYYAEHRPLGKVVIRIGDRRERP